MAGVDDYRRELRAAVRAYWSGVFGVDQFLDSFRLSVNRALTRAWAEGAKECGIGEDELTPEENLALGTAIESELSHIAGFGLAIDLNSKEKGGKLSPLLGRVDRWIARYDDLKSRARVMACADKKLKWLLGPTGDHCKTCLKLDGKVKRASQWRAAGIQPRNPPNMALECRGWGLCQLVPTDEPLSRGPLPRV